MVPQRQHASCNTRQPIKSLRDHQGRLVSPSFRRQELLWEARRPWVGGESEASHSSPDTAVLKRAAALESRRFLAAVGDKEAEAKRRADEGDGALSSPGEDVADGDGGEGKAEAPVRCRPYSATGVQVLLTGCTAGGSSCPLSKPHISPAKKTREEYRATRGSTVMSTCLVSRRIFIPVDVVPAHHGRDLRNKPKSG